jgi:hypothetical protein
MRVSGRDTVISDPVTSEIGTLHARRDGAGITLYSIKSSLLLSFKKEAVIAHPLLA